MEITATLRGKVSVLHAWTIGDEVAGGFADAIFRDPADWEARVYLSLVLQRRRR